MLLKRNIVSYQLWLWNQCCSEIMIKTEIYPRWYFTPPVLLMFLMIPIFFLSFFLGGVLCILLLPPPPSPAFSQHPTHVPWASILIFFFFHWWPLVNVLTIAVIFRGLYSGGEMCVVWGVGRRGGFGEVGGWGGGGGEIFTVCMMTPWKWRCQGRETVLLLEGAPSSLWLGRESMCCVCSQCGKQRLGLLPLPSPVLPLVSSWHLLDSCPDSYC